MKRKQVLSALAALPFVGLFAKSEAKNETDICSGSLRSVNVTGLPGDYIPYDIDRDWHETVENFQEGLCDSGISETDTYTYTLPVLSYSCCFC